MVNFSVRPNQGLRGSSLSKNPSVVPGAHVKTLAWWYAAVTQFTDRRLPGLTGQPT